MDYKVVSAKPGASGAALVSGEVTCDGTPNENEVPNLPAQPLTINLSPAGTMPSTVSAYAILATS